jgi:chemotaxis protein MotC
VTRKKVFILAGLVLALGAATGTAFIFQGARILSFVPFVGKATQVADIRPDGQQIVGEHPSQQHQSGDSVEEKKTESGESDSMHGGNSEPAKSKESAKIELVPATDYVAPRSKSSTIVNSVNAMSALQTRMAQGKQDAPLALKSLMLRVPEIVAATNVSVMSNSEIQSIAVYGLSGGDPAIVTRMLKTSTLTLEQRSLLMGVKSYATGDFTKASANLLPLDPKNFEIALGAQLAMTQSQLAKDATAPENIKRLAFAADVLPGTLIEEAAIRRILPNLAIAGDARKVSYWAQRYLRRFPDSLYYQDFEVGVVDALTRVLPQNPVPNYPVLADILRTAGEKRAASLTRKILLRVMLDGNEEGCSSVGKALADSYDTKKEIFRVTSVLIQICGSTAGGPKELEALKSVNGAMLDENVRQHLSEAIAMSEAILNDGLPQDDGKAGPYLPMSADDAHAPMFASVAQQLKASVLAIRSVDDDEAGTNN